MVDSAVPVESVDVLVIGSGAAGLSVALGAADRRVCVISRGRIGHDGSSVLAQGGIAAALGEDDSASRHARDTLIAGAGHGDASAVARLTHAGRETIEWLLALGCPLDRRTDGTLRLALEAAHSRSRIVHAGGDRSGALLMKTLCAALGSRRNVDARAGWRALAPLMSADAVVGARVRTARGDLRDIRADAVVLACGGMSALYPRYTGSPFADGAGLCFASAASADLRDLEFVQFHPTALVATGDGSGRAPLLSEALRGAGARLRNARGQSLFADDDAHGGDLGPRDRVARAVFQASRDGGAFLDLRGDLATDLDSRFPTAASICRQHRIDPARQPLPVSPAAHYHMGGVAVDAHAATRVPGKFAVGEVACSGVHGANRLASNSLLEALASGLSLGQRLAAGIAPASGRLPGFHAAATVADDPSPRLRSRLADCLWNAAGPLRDGVALERGLAATRVLATGKDLTAADRARVQLVGRLLEAALLRRQSLGAHFRTDGADSPTTGSPRAA